MALNVTDIEMLQCSTQPVSVLQFLISPFFVIILIYFVCTIPFIGLGIIDVFNRVGNWSKQRAGYILMRKKLSNLHWLYFWTKPTGRKVSIKTEEGIELELPIEIQEGMLGLEKELKNVHFISDNKPCPECVKEEQKAKKAKEKVDVHTEKGKPSQQEIEAAFDVIRRMGK